MAEDRAEQLTRNPDKIVQELDKRVRADLRKTGDFPRVQTWILVPDRRRCGMDGGRVPFFSTTRKINLEPSQRGRFS
jgi:hypothetical protein